jgi:hypothetical protein
MPADKPPDHALIKMRWPETYWGRAALWASVAYGIVWLLFFMSPELKNTLLGVPYLGPAIFWFTAVYVFGLIVWVLWWLFGP